VSHWNESLNSTAFTIQSDKIKHHFEAVANHSAIELIGRKCSKSEVRGAMSYDSNVTSQAQQFGYGSTDVSIILNRFGFTPKLINN
jgi:hypothetical protein